MSGLTLEKLKQAAAILKKNEMPKGAKLHFCQPKKGRAYFAWLRLVRKGVYEIL